MGRIIAVLADKDIYTLIRNTFSNMEIVKIDSVEDLFREDNERVECLIFKIENESSLTEVEKVRELGITIVGMGDSIEYRKIVNYIRDRKIDNYIDERDYYLIENIVNESENAAPKDYLFIRDGMRASVIEIETINYVEYDGAKRRAVVVTDKMQYAFKTKLFELEEKLKMKSEIVKADKSTLINIKKIDFRQNEEVFFKNSHRKIFSRAVVRKLEYFICRRMAVEL